MVEFHLWVLHRPFERFGNRSQTLPMIR